MSAATSPQPSETEPTTVEWGIELEGVFAPLDHDVPMTRETAETALAEALDYGVDPETVFVVTRRVTPWIRATQDGAR